MSQRIFYTDGSANSQNRLGGWAFIELDQPFGSIVDIDFGFADDTTNNRMEMTAVLAAINSCVIGSGLYVVTDSGYVYNGYTHPSYLDKWVTKGWKNSKKEPVPNRDLWEDFLMVKQMDLYNIQWEHVRGHSKDAGNPHNKYNELADMLCNYKRRDEFFKISWLIAACTKLDIRISPLAMDNLLRLEDGF